MRSRHPVKENINRVYNAVTALILRGYEVECVRDIDAVSKPTIIVKYNGQCEYARREGKAVCYVYGQHQHGAYRKWQMQLNQCRVVWEDR